MLSAPPPPRTTPGSPVPPRRADAGRLAGAADPRRSAAVVTLAGLVLAGLLLAGCGEPPEEPRGLPTLAPTATPSGSATPTPPPVDGLPGGEPHRPSADPGLVATACPGDPTAQRIIDLVRGRSGLLARDAKVSVRSGPLCAAGWQFTILDVRGYEPLQVVTRDQGGTLRLVTAGTDVCTVEVRVAGPPGLQTLACGSEEGALPVPVPPPTPSVPTPSTPSPLTPTPSGSSPGPGA
ncbi:hypothetical protein [Micromonospora sp. WMMD1082]|uniref:hypothetical protein n=1 Tax=Micromonospora sp. WMMD1082 TaxID=3016104 RepID=UPI002416719B|nr:hypothetical protein [Micromonospora sp. WMMD1082]MDG4794648.1 hypothetical protein [Micromonospora sp. WMMD1082]